MILFYVMVIITFS